MVNEVVHLVSAFNSRDSFVLVVVVVVVEVGFD